MNASIVALLLLAALASAASIHEEGKKENIQQLPDISLAVPARRSTTTRRPRTISTKHQSPTTAEPTKTTTPTTTPSTTTPKAARDGYELVGNFGYYKLHTDSQLFAGAWEACLKEGAHLLVVRSQEEATALQQWKRYEMPEYIHYGAHHRYANQKFVTIFDEPLESTGYSRWGWDYSNATFFNNRDYPLLVLDISMGPGGEGIYLSRDYEIGNIGYVCKKDL